MLGADDLVARSLVAVAALVATVLVALASIWLLRASANRRTLCVGLLLVGLLVENALIEPPWIHVGIQIYLMDVIALLMLATVCTAFVFRQLSIRGLPTVLWLAFGLLMMVSFVEGIQPYGKTAGVDVRPNLYFWIAGLYCCLVEFTERDVRQMARWCVWSAYALVGIAAYRWIGWLAGFVPLSAITEVGAGNEFRALPSGATFCVAAVGLVQFMAWMRGSGSRFSGLHALVFAVVVVVLQHRSVWLAAGVGHLFVLVQQSGHMPRRLLWLIGLFFAVGIGVVVATQIGALDRLASSLWESTISVADPRSTASDRMFGWEALMSDWIESPWGTILFGYPYGTSYRRVVARVVVEYSPHNFYVQLLLRVGLVGTLLFIAATLLTMVHALSATVESEFEHLLLRGTGLLLLVSLVYYVPYQALYIHGAVTGLAMAHWVRYGDIRRSRMRERARVVRAPPVRRQTSS
jgi:O-antigen ligase